jgi:hypothetical protein
MKLLRFNQHLQVRRLPEKRTDLRLSRRASDLVADACCGPIPRGLFPVVCYAIFWLLIGASSVTAQTLVPGQTINPSSLEWPRFYTTNGYEFAVYQPLISKWPGNQLEGRFVVAVRPSGTSNETYGVVFFNARTEIDKVNRLVTFEDLQLSKVDFPTQKAMENQYRSMLQSFQHETMKTIPLDHLEAVFAASADITKAKVQQVKNDPPRVIYTTQPAVLVLVDGSPILKPLVGNYQRVVNTRSVLLHDQDPAFQAYYLYAANRWYSAPSLEGPWSTITYSPADINAALQAALATKQVDSMAPKDPAAVPPVLNIYVSTVPAELIETTGVPNLISITGTDLLYVSNTSNAIFYYLDDGQYYILISGRWFKGASLYGPWAFIPPGQLPPDFQRIPAHCEKSNVMASVPGSPQAQEAVIANSIPQTATIQRDQAKLTVVYEGAPSFVAIPGTTLTYAVNTSTPVIMVGPNKYYACQSGLWFVGSSVFGPWAVATVVPGVIYTIPVACPIHYVTYAYVYGSTPTVVYVGYTPGYMGTVVAPGGVVVYGTGYVYPPVVVGTTYISYPPTYGYGASLAMGAAVGFAIGYCVGSSSTCCCEPHWGCYAVPMPYSYTHCNVAATSFYTSWGTAVHATGSYGYNPYTGTSWGSQHANTYNPYTGTSGSVYRSGAYNPYTGNAAASRGGSWYNPYSGANAQASGWASGNKYTGNYSGGRQASGYNPSTGANFSGSSSFSGNAYNGNYSGSRQGSGYNPSTGSSFNGSSSISGNTQTGNYDASRQTSANNGNTGRYESGSTTVSGNVQNGTASVSSSGSAGNSKTGNSASWNNGNMYADHNGNMYSYNQASGAQKYNTSTSTYQPVTKPTTTASPNSYNQSNWGTKPSSSSSGSSPASSSWGGKAAEQSSGSGWGGSSARSSNGWSGADGSSSWANRMGSAQSTGSQRFGSWADSGGGGWGGSRGGGGWRR